MAELSDLEFVAAEAKGVEMLERETRASSVRYDGASGRIVIELTNGCAYAVPTHLVQDLQGIPPDDLEAVVVDGAGFNLHWPQLDVDLYVPALLNGVFGTQSWMRTGLARIAGRSKSDAKAAASRVNGVQGGRPRKSAAG